MRKLLIITLAAFIFACSNNNSNNVTITGTITNPKGDIIEFKTKDSTYTTNLTEQNTFSIILPIDSSTYLSFYHGDESTRMYVNANEKINLSIDTDLFDETITYEGSTESSFLAKKYLLEENQNLYGKLFNTEKEVYLNNLNSFRDSLYTLAKSLENKNFADSEIKNIDQMYDFFAEKIEVVTNMPKEGEKAIDFTYPDKEGIEHSLLSFKGTLVYVDVWATWCGPCKAEIPALKELEKDYQNKNITFLSVSVDTDKEAWLNMLAEQELGGVQLWADGWSEITKDYAIFGIPRFMLFDTEGNIISVDAPRPSSDEIRSLLDSNLGDLLFL